MTTRAEEIAADGPYRVEKSSGVYVIMGPHGRWPFHFSHESTAKGRADDFNKVYKQGRQDRWISVKDRMPEPNIEVLVAFADDTVAGTSQWCRVKSPDIMGWLGPAENKGKTITHWTPLPLTP